MPILLTISVLALFALLWAGASIVQHIRTSRRRHRILRDKQPHPFSGTLGLSPAPLRNEFAEYSFAALAPSASTRQPAVHSQPGTLPSAPSPVLRLITLLDAVQVAPELPQATAPVSRPIPAPRRVEVITEPIPERPIPVDAQLTEISAEIISLESTPTPIEVPLFTADRRPPTRALPPQPQPIAEPLEAIMASATEEESPELRRPVRSVHPHPSAPFIPLRRPDWVYFNKDMGDLSDPAPSRIRERARAR